MSGSSVIYYFNSRPHEEVDRSLPEQDWGLPIFQLTTSRGGRRLFFSILIRFLHKHFNSRPHEEVDAQPQVIIAPRNYISTHDLTRRSTPLSSIVGHDAYVISTHDLTRRSTYGSPYSARYWNISTHDLTRRSTTSGTTEKVIRTFQLTTSRGGRQTSA